MSVGAKEDQSSTAHVWAAGFHHVMAHSHLVGVFKLMNRFFDFQIFSGCSETVDTESADTGA
jgi:hypothetical protein